MHYFRYDLLSQCKPGGKVFLDSSLVDGKTERTDIEVYGVPVTQLSHSEHLEGIANIILLGKVLAETGFASFETVEEAVRKSVPARKEHLFVHNIRAIKLGMSL